MSTDPPAVAQRLRVRYAKRDRLRFISHRDFARALERALRRAGVPMASSAGFTPHPKVSYVGAAATGVASEAEFLELALAERVDVAGLRAALDAALPAGLDLVEVVEAVGADSLADRITASHWRIELPEVPPAHAERALKDFLARAEVRVERLTKSGRREMDARAPVVWARVSGVPADTVGGCAGYATPCAILDLVVRHVTPSVRPDDVLAGLRAVAAFEPPVAPWVTRLAQGPLDQAGQIADPLAVDRQASVAAGPA